MIVLRESCVFCILVFTQRFVVVTDPVRIYLATIRAFSRSANAIFVCPFGFWLRFRVDLYLNYSAAIIRDRCTLKSLRFSVRNVSYFWKWRFNQDSEAMSWITHNCNFYFLAHENIFARAQSTILSPRKLGMLLFHIKHNLWPETCLLEYDIGLLLVKSFCYTLYISLLAIPRGLINSRTCTV